MIEISENRLKRIVITTIIVLAILAGTLFLATRSTSNEQMRQRHFTPEQELAYSEQIDSIAAHLEDSTKVVARLSNEVQYGLIYMRAGRIFIYDAVENQTTELEPTKLNVAARVSHADGGILTAKVDADENYLLMVAATGSKDTERGLYRYDILRKKVSVLAIGKVEPNGSGYIVYERDLEIHFNSMGDKISEMIHTSSFDEGEGEDSEEKKPQKRRRSERQEDESASNISEESSPAETHNAEPALEPVPRLD